MMDVICVVLELLQMSIGFLNSSLNEISPKFEILKY